MNLSLQRKLNRWILGATAIFALVTSSLSGWNAFNEARELQDNLLQQLASFNVTHTGTGTTTKQDYDPEDTLVVQHLGTARSTGPVFPADLADGYHTLDVNGNSWRLFVYTAGPSGKNQAGRFAIAQRTEVRDEVAWTNSLQTFLPVLLLAPFLMAIASFAINHSLAPVRELAREVDQRQPAGLETLPDHDIPAEIRPFVLSINRLLERLQQQIQQQHRFVADAAHELRTPVTGLSLLVENLDSSRSMDEMHQRLVPVQQGLVRMRNLIAQLLDLARLQGESPANGTPVDLQKTLTDVIADVLPQAEAKGIDLGLAVNDPVTIDDGSDRIRLLLQNAIENAIRYTPDGGKVDVSLYTQQDRAVFQVSDNGCGIPEQELEQVFEPFYRVGVSVQPGNGLGLAICHEIAHQLGGKIELRNRSSGGLVFQYSQPMKSA